MEKVEQDVMNASGVLKFFHVANNVVTANVLTKMPCIRSKAEKKNQGTYITCHLTLAPSERQTALHMHVGRRCIVAILLILISGMYIRTQ